MTVTPSLLTTVSTRALSTRQIATRRALIVAATALADEDAQRSFTMRDVARRAGVSAATAYTYFGSRDHVLAEAYAEWVDALSAGLVARPPRGRTPASRVRAVARRAGRGVAEAPELARAFTLALVADDPSVALIRPRIQAAFAGWWATALGEELADREAAITTLELVFFGAMISFAHGLTTTDDLAATLEAAVRLVLAD